MATRQREKKENREKTRDRRPMAEAKYIRIASSKVEIVLDLVRGKKYAEAVAILSNTRKSACEPVLKLLKSAAANAENNNNMPKDDLYIAECWSSSGPTLKRMMPRARGRADRILKRTSHITIILDEKVDASKPKTALKKPVKAAEKKGGETVKKETVKTPQKKTSAKEVPVTQGERPLTTEPNSKKPLGMKKETEAKKPSASKPAVAKKETK